MSTREEAYREKIRANLDNVLHSGYIPELGKHQKGKVRDLHFTGDRIGDNLIMVASDRVSAFDRVLKQAIPYKGVVLNALNDWAMNITNDIVPNASRESPDPNVVIQQRMKNAGFEFIVRGYVWGSLAADYEKGNRIKSGIRLPDGLLRYEELKEPIFTPTTKAETGHDEDITLEDIVKVHGTMKAHQLEGLSLKLFRRGSQQAFAANEMLLLDTKFEFGLDEDDNLYLIDECLTPDSSRYTTSEEYKKFEGISDLMGRGKYITVSALLKARPDLKIKEESKQYVRDVLLESGFSGDPDEDIPDLTEDQIVETSLRYILAYEKITGESFDFDRIDYSNPQKRIMKNLVEAGLAYGGCVVPIGASISDENHWKKLEKKIRDVKIPSTKPFYTSAHKEPIKVLDYVNRMDSESIEPLVYLTFAGRSNGLGPVVAAGTKNPVITCPVFSDIASYSVDIHSSLRMPSNVPLMTVVDPGNAVLAAKRIIDLTK